MSKRIYASLKELEAIIEWAKTEKTNYVGIDYTNGPLWHDLDVHNPPYGKSYRIPLQQGDNH